jgi:hypothetical protein
MWKRAALVIIITIFSTWGVANALDFLKGVMPGKVAHVHAKYEGKCLDCHNLVEKVFYDKCMACHKEVKKNVEQKTGYHGKTDVSHCETCHGEHKGRAAKLVQLDPAHFDHHKTQFELSGKHQKVKCESCHQKPKFRETPHDCFSCHLKKDKHKGALGKTCQRCHNAEAWDRISFDHARTHFPLEGKHTRVACEKCHASDKFKATPTACVACHRKQDKHKGTLGKECESCHTAKEWKQILFDHDKTRFKLEGRHRTVDCLKCHTSRQLRNTPKTCVECHKKDDYHKGILGPRCEQCHTARDWKEILFDHDKTRFRLVDSHQKVDCLKCHTTPHLRKTPKTCNECHKKDDRHKGKLGTRCDQCHTVVRWKRISFDHSTTSYPLTGKHVQVGCTKCHRTEPFKIPSRCISCHSKDDKHKDQLGQTCEKCHSEKGWKDVKKFNHQVSRFPLLDKHTSVRCGDCHKTPLFRDTSMLCYDCHKKDDYHEGHFGEKCDACHTAKTWKRDDFDHEKETGYALVKKHSTLKCIECHVTELFVHRTSRMCVQCHRKDDIHAGELGTRCDICHSEAGFKIIKRISMPGARRGFPNSTGYGIPGTVHRGSEPAIEEGYLEDSVSN